ncbi:unnamed protein product [Tuwongella immobilis]|uniref:Uncharacterized protein n=1 Tax=Tuwongella immobilis TaxID=692036 RepID=A0A6C2YN82_9BACT|nr:unnamed protein product [Tuwongella immobilis]VTS01838.1 unnamed protein product [Tuwongella immobilis]
MIGKSVASRRFPSIAIHQVFPNLVIGTTVSFLKIVLRSDAPGIIRAGKVPAIRGLIQLPSANVLRFPQSPSTFSNCPLIIPLNRLLWSNPPA